MHKIERTNRISMLCFWKHKAHVYNTVRHRLFLIYTNMVLVENIKSNTLENSSRMFNYLYKLHHTTSPSIKSFVCHFDVKVFRLLNRVIRGSLSIMFSSCKCLSVSVTSWLPLFTICFVGILQILHARCLRHFSFLETWENYGLCCFYKEFNNMVW